MKSREIITSINKIYQEFKIPINLQNHMFRAATIAEMVCDNWQGPEICREDIIATNLIHDLGNIVKMDFKTRAGLKLIVKKDLEKIKYWQRIQQETIKKYGSIDHVVTEKMAVEIGLNKRQEFLLANKEFRKNKFIYESDDFDLKICAYGDQRSGPFGVLTVQQRKNDWQKRYKNREKIKKITGDSNLLFAYTKKIEKQIFKHVSIRPEDINDISIERYLQKYKN